NAEIKSLQKRLLEIDDLTPQRLEKIEGNLTAEERLKLPKRTQTILAIAPNGRTPRQEQELLDSLRKLEQVRHVVGGLANPWAMAAQTHLLQTRIALAKQIDSKKKELPADLTTLILNERKSRRMTNVQLGGDFLRKGALVKPGVPAVLPDLPEKDRGQPDRLALAKWLVDGKNPLVGR